MAEKKETKTKESSKKKTAVKKTTNPKKSVKKAVKKEIEKPTIKAVKYYEAIGRRKTAKARVRLFTQGEKEFLVNNKPYNNYFKTLELQQKTIDSLKTMKCLEKFRVLAQVKGSGFSSQAEAIRHGIARALVIFNPDFKKRLRRAGFLTRDPRMRERKKFGLKRARRAPQWRKR